MGSHKTKTAERGEYYAPKVHVFSLFVGVSRYYGAVELYPKMRKMALIPTSSLQLVLGMYAQQDYKKIGYVRKKDNKISGNHVKIPQGRCLSSHDKYCTQVKITEYKRLNV